MRLEARPVSIQTLGLVKMEDRKRAAVSDLDDSVPPAKRQATLVNGTKPSSEMDRDPEWLEVGQPFPLGQACVVARRSLQLTWFHLQPYQKDALVRQMKEYKREKTLLAERVTEMEKRSTYHDDHLRIIDEWLRQLIDDIKLRVDDLKTLGASEPDEDGHFPPSLWFADNDRFQEHLAARSSTMKVALSDLFGKLPATSPEATSLQQQVSKLLAAEKSHIVELQRVTAERDQLFEQLEKASERYMKAERRMDRMQSAAVAKLEQQATQSSRPLKTEAGMHTDTNGTTDGVAVDKNAETARKEAMAVAEKRKEQLEQLETANADLTKTVTALQTRLTGLSEDDFAKSETFKVLRSQHEDVIQRINHLEATNVRLREEAQRLQAERSQFRSQMEEESRTEISEVESQRARAETDLTRIRNARDELVAELTLKKAALEQHRTSIDQTKELASARESRIAALETEVERMRLLLGEVKATSDSLGGMEKMTPDELRSKIGSLEKAYALLNNELPSMEAAWKKAQTLAVKKIAEMSSWEDQAAKLYAEKAKADQKYFGAMKAKEAREVENRALRTQNVKSSEIITQLKEAESSTRALAVNLEKQLAEAKEALSNLSNQQRSLQQKLNEHTITSEGLSSQVAELKKSLSTKDSTVLAATHAQREADVAVEELKIELENSKMSVEDWKKKASANKSDIEETLRVGGSKTLLHCTGNGTLAQFPHTTRNSTTLWLCARAESGQWMLP